MWSGRRGDEEVTLYAERPWMEEAKIWPVMKERTENDDNIYSI